MAVFFSGTEILEVAVNIEENGLAFYQAVAKTTPHPELKAAFDYLAGQEKVHKQVFLKMQESAGKSWAVEGYPGEEAAYLKALADSIVFTPDLARELVKKMASDEQALDTALGFEKNSILFYSEMEKLVREQDRKVIDWVIDQEKSHVTRILDLKKMLKSPDIQDYGH